MVARRSASTLDDDFASFKGGQGGPRCYICTLPDKEPRGFIERQKGKASAYRVHAFLTKKKVIDWRTDQPIKTHWKHMP